MTAFYITTAAYRVFKFRNIDASVLLICGMIVLTSTLPLFTNVFPWLVPLRTWLTEVPVRGANRALTLGVSLGAIGLGLRVMLHRHEEMLG
jgi:multisubunit Na+/H+ antiporter MnhB subunit